MRTGWGSRFTRGGGLYGSKTKNIKKKGAKLVKLSANQFQKFIDIKKEHDRWDASHRPLYRNIGLSISLLLMIFAFNWKTYEAGAIMSLGEVEDDMHEIMEIPVSEQPPPPPPKMHKVFEIREVEDTEIIEEIEVALDIEVNEQTEIEEVEYVVAEVEEKVEEIFTIVEEEPMPKGGLSAFYTYVQESMEYPKAALRLGVTGVVFVQFVVEKDGSLTDIQVAKGIGAGCDEEAVRVLKAAPKWNPGKQRGVPVRVKKIMPIRFVLEDR